MPLTHTQEEWWEKFDNNPNEFQVYETDAVLADWKEERDDLLEHIEKLEKILLLKQLKDSVVMALLLRIGLELADLHNKHAVPHSEAEELNQIVNEILIKNGYDPEKIEI